MEVAGLVFGVIGVIPFVEYCKSKIEEPLKQIRENRREFETLKKRFNLIKSSHESVQTGSDRITESISIEQENNYQQKLEFVGKEIEICTDIINELEAQNPGFSEFQHTASRRVHSVRTRAKNFIYARSTKKALLDLRTKVQEIEKVLGEIRSLSARCESSVRPDDRRQVYYVLPASKICSDFRFCAGEEPESVEAKLKGLVLGGTSRTNLSSVAKESLFCTFGKPGVGKTSALIAIGNDIDIREHFCGGIFFETFGKDATQKTLIATFAKIARLSGGISLGRRIEGLSSPTEAAMELNVWFRGTRILYLFDDIWDSEYLPALKMLTSSSNNMIISTRDSGIEQLSDYSVLFPFHPPRGQKAKSIFGKHANITDDDMRVCELEVDNLLTTFDGHAIALAIAGSLVRECVLSDNKLISALKHVLRVARNHKSVASKEIHDYTYSSMFGAVEASLTHICNLMHPKNSWGFGMTNLKLDVRTLFLRLSVLKNQVWIPISLLKHLWKFNSTEDAKKIADRFASHQLLTLKLKDNERFDIHGYDSTGYIMHDLVLEFCQSEVSPEFIRETHIRGLLGRRGRSRENPVSIKFRF